MTEFLDGPAEGVTLWLRRCPLFLRVVRSERGEWDALDQILDAPKPGELVFAYQRVGSPSWVHVCARGKGLKSKVGGYYVTANYKYVDLQPSEQSLRSNEDWQRWCNGMWERV